MPAFKIGDFVVCDYEYIAYVRHYYQRGDQVNASLYYGIVVGIDWSFYEYMEEYVYEILCLDGEKKYFMESEINFAYPS